MTVIPTRDPETIAKLARVMSECIPGLVARSTVGLVASVNQHARQIGSGTLLAVAEHRFVVTAAHVLHQASLMSATVGVSGTRDTRFVAATGNWALSSGASNSDSDEVDLAIYEFTTDQAGRFAEDAFVRVGDVAFPADLSHAFFVVSGFPAVWSTSLAPSEITLRTKMFQYGTFSLQGSHSGLAGYNPERHFLLEAAPDFLVDHQGNESHFRTRAGHSARIPDDLAGISGCSVWILGDLRTPTETWTLDRAKLVGVETSVYKGRHAIKATRWNAVTTLLYAAFPQVRAVLEMYESSMAACTTGEPDPSIERTVVGKSPTATHVER